MAGHPRPAGPDPVRAALVPRAVALTASVLAAWGAYVLFLQVGVADGFDAMDVVRAVLILVSTWWLAWGASLALLGLTTRARPPAAVAPLPASVAALAPGRTVILMPVYNEDPVSTFARVAAMDADLAASGQRGAFHIAILSDTRKDDIAALERRWFLRLLRDTGGEGRIFYRRRATNRGRKAGNIEDFIQRSGGAYDYAIILDADSLMDAATMIEMVRRIAAEPDLGLIQTLPRIVRAQSRFGRTMQFSAAFHSPVFARGLAMLQGRTGPFWGHNAIVRVRAFAETCGLPELSGPPPLGGHILSHDYVEAALLARGGWRVRLDDDLGGSYEEGPENIVDHARRDRRWCQGNLQHARLIGAPGLRLWSRFVFVQNVAAYIAPLFWIGFLAASLAATAFAPPPNYFPEPNWPFPMFPRPETAKAVLLAIGIFGLLLLPKLFIALDAALRGRARGFGGAVGAFGSTLVELVTSSVLAPILLAFQTRSVLQVLTGRDGGWPTNNRGDGRLTLAEAWRASYWIVAIGAAGLAATALFAPDLVLWLLPVGVPMLLAPAVIAWTSRPARSGLFATPEGTNPPAIVRRHDAILADWQASPLDTPNPGVSAPLAA